MIVSRRALRGGLAFLALVANACTPAPPLSAQSRADQQTMTACRQRADEVFAEQNRGAPYDPDYRLSPFSSSYVPGITTRGLGERYSRDTMIDNCVRNAGTSSPNQSSAPIARPDAR
jgi:hypothetical protein